MTDAFKPPAEPPSFELQMIDYLRARLRQETCGTTTTAECIPQWVPSAIRMMDVDQPSDVPCTATLFGLIHIAGEEWGRTIRIDFSQCEILAFRWNESRAIVLRERAEGTDLKSQIANLKSKPEASNADPA